VLIFFGPVKFSPGALVSSTNKTDRHDITEILLKVVLSTLNLYIKLILIIYYCPSIRTPSSLVLRSITVIPKVPWTYRKAIAIETAKSALASASDIRATDAGKALMALKTAEKARLMYLFRNAHAVMTFVKIGVMKLKTCLYL
jgi:hypothetical protein